MNATDESCAAGLIRGAYDLHVHTAPDVLPRKLDDLEMARRAAECSMAGFAIKSHFFCTAERAETVNHMQTHCRAIGAIALNHAVGGINPIAVEMAARAGARMVWFPTCDAQWERTCAQQDASKKAFWVKIVDDLAENGIKASGIDLLDGSGKLKPCVQEVLDVIGSHELVLCTGHISHAETFILVREAQRRGIKRIIITHVTFPSTFYTIDEQRELIRMGAKLEQCYSTYATGKVDKEVMFDQIRRIGAEHFVLGSDLGQTTRDYPEKGMMRFLSDLLEGGFSEQEIKTMACQNSEALIQA